MNRIYRLVFNRALGVMQVASELSQQKQGAAGSGNGRQVGVVRGLSFSLWLALAWVGVLLPVHAQQAGTLGRIVTDQQAPRDQRPVVVAAPNGTPLVNISTPTAGGVSRNAYSQFDVGRQGVILNNARVQTQTQLGGWVEGNPYLATGTAKIILNEVNSANPSYLNGYVEVGGQRAEVIIANPAGIQVNGGGFINASRATLTTGTPVFNGGSLDRYRVQGGSVSINGAGLDASGTDYTQIIARSLQLNAGLWAEQLSVLTGANLVDAATGSVASNTLAANTVAAAGNAPRLAIDVGQLGGMYAGKIRLIGTENGVGVRNAGNIGAQAGELVVTSAGRLENTGALQSQTNTRVQAADGVRNAGTLSAQRELTVDTPATVDNGGGVLNGQRVQVNAQGLSNRDGTIEQTGLQGLALASASLSNGDGGRIGLVATPGPGTGGNPAAPPNTGNPGSPTAPGQGSGGGVDSPGTGTGSTGPALPPVPPLADGVLNIAGALNNDGGRIIAGGGIDLALDGSQGLNNSGGQMGLRNLALEGGTLSNDEGTLAIAGSAQLHAQYIDNNGGQLNVAGPLSLQVERFSNRGGRFQQADTALSRWQVSGLLDNSAGTLASNAAALTINAGTLVNADGRIDLAGTQGLAINTGSLRGARGAISSAGAVSLNAADIDHRGATLSATQTTLNADSLDNRGGTLISSGDGSNTLQVQGALDNGAGGTIASNGNLAISAGRLGNAAGSIQQAGTGMLAIDTGELSGAEGRLISNGRLQLQAQAMDLRGAITSAQQISLRGDSLEHAGGRLSASGEQALDIAISGALNNRGGAISSNGALQLQAGSLDNRGGGLTAAGGQDSRLQVDGRFDNSAGSVASNGNTLTIRSNFLVNEAGRIEHAGDGALNLQTGTLQGAGGSLISNAWLQLRGGAMDLSGASTRARQLTLQAASLQHAGGNLSASGEQALQLQVEGALDNREGRIAGNGALQLQAQSLDNNAGNIIAAGTEASTLAVEQTLDNRAGTLAVQGDVALSAQTFDNTGGSLQHAGDGLARIEVGTLQGAAGNLLSNGQLQLKAAGEVNLGGGTTSAEQVSITAAKLITAEGRLAATGTQALTLTLREGLDNRKGTIAGNGNLVLEAASLDNREGSIGSAGQQASRIGLSGTLDNRAGRLVSNGSTLTLNSARLLNQDGRIQQAGTQGLNIRTGNLDGNGGLIASAGALNLQAADIAHRNATLNAAQVTLNARSLDNRGGQLMATGGGANTLTLSNTLNNQQGTLASNGSLSLRASTLDNTQGRVQQAADGVLDIAVQTLAGNGGNLLSNGALVITGQRVDLSAGTTSAEQISITSTDLNNADGQLTATGDGRLMLSVSQALDNQRGSIAGNGTLALQAGRLNNADGSVQSAGAGANTLAVDSLFDNTGGQVLSAGDSQMSAATLNNAGGSLRSAGAAQLQLRVDGAVDNQQGLIAGGGETDIGAASIDNQRGTLASVNGALTVTGQLNNAAGSVQSGELLSLTSEGLNNAGGRIIGGQATLNAGRGVLDNRGGTLASSQGDMRIGSGRIDNAAGIIQSTANLSVDSNGQLLDNGQGGNLISGGTTVLRSGQLNNQGGLVFSQGDADVQASDIDNGQGGQLSSATNLSLRGRQLTNAGGTVQAGGNASVAVSGALNNQAGFIAAGQALALSAASIDNRDTLAADNAALGLQGEQVDVSSVSLDNRQGNIGSDASTVLSISEGLQNQQGRVASGGSVNIAAQTIGNTEGTLLSGGNQTVTADSLSGDGKVLSQGDLTVALQQDFNNTGEISAQGNARLSTAGSLSNQGLLQAGNLSLNANNIDNALAGEIASTGTTAVNARGTLSNRGLIDGRLTYLQAQTLDNTGSGRIYGDQVALQAGTLNNRAETLDGVARSATIAARQRLDIGAGTLNNLDESLIYSGGDAAIGGALDADLLATGTAEALNNLSAGIDISGDLDIRTATLLNERKNVVIEQATTVREPVTLERPDWWNNGGNSSGNIRSTSNYIASTVFYLHPDDILEDSVVFTPDGYPIRKAVIRLTSQTSAFYFGRGSLYRASGERSRLDVEAGTITLYYMQRQDNQANPDQVAVGADDPFAELDDNEPGAPNFRYVDDTLSYSDQYGTCTTNCVQLWGQFDYTDPDAILVNGRGRIGGNDLGAVEKYRIATQTVTEDRLVSAGPDATIYSGGDMAIATDEVTNRYGQIVAAGDLRIQRLNGSQYAEADRTNIGATLYRTYAFDNVSYAHSGASESWSNAPQSETIGQVGGVISAGGTLSVEGGDLSNLDQGRQAPNVRDAGALASLGETRTGGVEGVDGSAVNGPDRATGNSAERVSGQTEGAGNANGRSAQGPGGVNGSDATSISGRPLTQVANVAGDNPGRVVSVALETRVPSNSLFKVQPEAGNYLIETDPRFADYRNWLSSDYLLDALGYGPDRLQKRLGDGYYEQKLVREQIAQLTGRRFLQGYASDEDQYRGLMESGAAFAQKYNLRPGVALSAAQMAQLTSDIVWLVEQTITLADGSTTTALVPQLYVRLQPGDLEPGGALLAGENVRLKLSDDATNTGAIAGRKLVTLEADNIRNLQGASISGAQVGLQARQDIDIIGSTVTASEALSAQAGGDIRIASTLADFDGGTNTQTTIDRVAGLYVTAADGQGALSVNAGNNLLLAAATLNNAGRGNTVLKADNDLTLATLTEQRSQTRGDIENGGNGYSQSSTTNIGSTISGAGNVVLAAGNDLSATAANVSAGQALAVVAGNNLSSQSAIDRQRQSSRDVGKKHSDNYDTYDETVQGSSFTAGGDIAMQAGNDLTLQSASVISESGAVNLAAGNDLSLTTTQEQHDLSTSRRRSKSGLLSSKQTRTADTVQESIAVGSTISGNTVGLRAGNDMTITGSQVISDAGTALLAGNDITIESAQDTYSESSSQSRKKSGFSANFSGGVASVGYNKSKNASEYSRDSVTQVASGVGSINGNTTVVAGNTLTIAASDVAAGGDVVLSGKDVVLEARQDTVVEQGRQSSKSSGFSTGITLNPVESYQDARDGATRNMPRTGSALNELSRTGEGVAAGTRAASTTVVFQAGSNKSNSQQDRASSNARVSQVSAGGDLTIVASEGSITSQGAQLAAEGDAVLLAKQDIVFDVAHNSQGQGSYDTGSGWGVANNTTGLPVGMHNNQGDGQGATDTITGTQLSVGGSTLMATQEGDITLTAANVVSQGDTTINAARNLTIQSGQDTAGNQNQRNNQAIGTVVVSDTERFSGYYSEQRSDSNSRVTQVASNVGSLGGNVNLSAGNAYTQTASNVLAGNDINVRAKTIDILTADDIGSQQNNDESFKFGVFGRVSSPLIDLVNNVDAARQSDGRLQAMQGLAAAATGYQAYQSVKDGVLASVEAGIGVATSEADYQSRYRESVGSTLSGGGNVNLTSTEGDIRVKQGNLQAGDTLSLDSANNIVLEAGQSGYDQQGSSSYAGAEVGVGASVGAQTGVYIYGQASVGSSSDNASGATYQNTQLAGDTINLTSKGDTTLRGATAQGNTINADIGGNLNIESLQDIAEQQANSSQVGGRVQVSLGTAWSASGGAGTSRADGSYTSVKQQSGLFAGDGGYRINADTVDLKGGAITSTNAGNSELTANALSFSNVQNAMDYKALTASINGGMVGEAIEGDGFAPASQKGLGLGAPVYESGDQSSTTYATLTEGNITLGGVATTAEATGINTDAEKAHVPVAELPDLQQVLFEQTVTAYAVDTSYDAISTYVGSQEATLGEQLQQAGSAEEQAQIQSQLDNLKKQEQVLNILVAAVSGAGGQAVTQEALASAADWMREQMVAQSEVFPGVVDSEGNVLSNVSGVSDGVDGDGVKLGGTRVDLDKLCGAANERCARKPDGSLDLNKEGQVVFTGVLSEFLVTEKGKEMGGLTGGIQGYDGTIAGKSYSPDGSWDSLIEGFAGPHDFIGGELSGLYDEQGNAVRGRPGWLKTVHETWSVAAVPIAAPFPMAKNISPEVWRAISILLRSGR